MTVTVGDVKDEIAVTAESVGLSDTQFDGVLSALIERETERVADELDVRLGVETTTEVTERPVSVREFALPLSDRPIQSVTSVGIDTDRVAGDGVTLDDVIVGSAGMELKPDADRTRWPTDRRSITVEYDHGVPDNDRPEVIDGAIVGLVRHAVAEIEADGINSESIDGHNVDYELGDDVIARHLSRALRFDEPDFFGGTQVV